MSIVEEDGVEMSREEEGEGVKGCGSERVRV